VYISRASVIDSVCVCVCVCLYRSVSLYPLSRICVRLTKVQCICAVVKVEYVQFE